MTDALPPAAHTRAEAIVRWAAIVTLLASAAFHVPVITPHLSEAPYIGVLFIVLVVVCVALAVVLAIHASVVAWVAAGIVTALAVVAYVLSRTVGLPEIGDDIGNWGEPLGVASITAETLTVLLAAFAVFALAEGRRRAAPRPC